MHHLIETSLTLVCLCNIIHLMSDPEGNSQFCFPESLRENKANPVGPDIKRFVIFLDFHFNSNKRIIGAKQNSRYLAHKTNLASAWNKYVRFATRSRLGSSQLNVLFSGGPYHPINPKNCIYIVFYILVPSQSRRALQGVSRGTLFPCSLRKLGCVALFPLLFLICSLLFHRTHLSPPPQRPQKASIKGPNAKIAGLIFFCLNSNQPDQPRLRWCPFQSFVLRNEATWANFNFNKRILIQQPFLYWVYRSTTK